jgi:diaminohydroxyphosphoribosylaminopyrimidine deaminase / 5-amino-6-(5-phosphoribosylamino)uracil reductase
MNEAIDWQRDAPTWPALLAAAGGGPLDAVRRSRLWPVYAPLVMARRENRRLVIGQAGQSLDGRVATVQGHSHYVNGPAGILHLHRLRALVDAVVVGAGTIVADNPQLTVREVEGPHPARIVIDRNGQASRDALCLADNGVRRIVLCAGPKPASNGVEFIAVDPFTPPAMLRAMEDWDLPGSSSKVGRKPCRASWPTIASTGFIWGKSSIKLAEIETLHEAMRPVVAHYPLPGGDVLFDCALR